MASKNDRFLTDSERERLMKELECIATTEQDEHKKALPIAEATSDQGDGLEDLVSALPSAFTKRFGEICWAQGGTGYGWWPSCIYDPRFTIGSARTQARRQLGRKHLVYFFQCKDTPFDLLPDSKIVDWHQGLAQGMYLGRTAKATGRHRFTRFQEALQAATIEEGKPQSRRLEWNHREGGHGMANLLPSPIQLVATAKKKEKKAKKARLPEAKVDPNASGREPRKRARRSIDFRITSGEHDEKQRSFESNGAAPATHGTESDSVAPDNTEKSTDNGKDPIYLTIGPDRHSFVSVTQPFFSMITEEVDVCFCQIYVTDQATSAASLGTCVGFVELPRIDCTFTETRQIIEETLDPEGLPPDWRFVHPTLGPLSLRMESSKGALIPYMQRGARERQDIGSGSVVDPFKVSITMDPLSSLKKTFLYQPLM